MIPSLGRVVAYTLSAQDAERVNRRRSDAAHARAAYKRSGYVVHIGNDALAGEVYPLVITRVWEAGYGQPVTEDTLVNGQVLLDGNDTLWVTSVRQGEGDGTWREFPRV